MTGQTWVDRILHRLALDSQACRRFCFERECESNDFAFEPRRNNVFVAGVARAGSTALLRALYASGAFAATTYAMMPLVLAPSLARLLARLPRSAPDPAERTHGDGIEVDLESPEALDGVFWSTFLALDDEHIEPREVPIATLRAYAMFIENLLVHAGAQRYLTKMNQGIDKLASLAAYFDGSVFLLPFREPLQQAASLQRQHLRFCHLSGYEKKYFAWLGHHEFGALHRRFCLDTAATRPAWDTRDLNYWLQQWHDGYSYLARLAASYPNLLPVCYEHMAQSLSFWEQLSRRLDADVSATGFVDRNRAEARSGDDIDAALYRDCRALYARLSRQSLCGGDP